MHDNEPAGYRLVLAYLYVSLQSLTKSNGMLVKTIMIPTR